MTEFLKFMGHHWALSLALVVVLILIWLDELKNRVGALGISIQEATLRINREHGVFVDVRSADEFAKGHIPNSLNMVSPSLALLKKQQNRPVVLIDDVGGSQANKWAHQLRKEGLSAVYVLVGGLRAWTETGLPLKKSS